MKVMIDIVEGWDGGRSLCQGAGRSRGIRVIEVRIVHDVTLLIDSVLVDRLHQVGCPGKGSEGCGNGKAIVEPTITRAHHGLRGSFSHVEGRPGQGKAWTPIRVIVNSILGF